MPLRTAASALIGLDDTALAKPSITEYERLRWSDRRRLVQQSGTEITSHRVICPRQEAHVGSNACWERHTIEDTQWSVAKVLRAKEKEREEALVTAVGAARIAADRAGRTRS